MKSKGYKVTWIKANHYHCKKCGKPLEFLARMKWHNVETGVRGYGICEDCSLIMVEYENTSKNKWIKI